MNSNSSPFDCKASAVLFPVTQFAGAGADGRPGAKAADASSGITVAIQSHTDSRGRGRRLPCDARS